MKPLESLRGFLHRLGKWERKKSVISRVVGNKTPNLNGARSNTLVIIIVYYYF